MARINAKDVVLELSTNGVTYNAAVCEIGHSLNRERSTQSTETKCYGGVAFVSIGAKSGTMDMNGLFETTPGAGQISANQINEYYEDGTYIYWRLTADGGNYYRQGRGYVTTLNETAEIPNFLEYDLTITIDGDVESTAP